MEDLGVQRKGLKKPQVSAERAKVKARPALACTEQTAPRSLSLHLLVTLPNVQFENGPTGMDRAEILEKHQPEQFGCL